MKEGTISLVRDTESPLKSPNTRLIAAALSAGAEFATKAALNDSVNDKGDRQVTWQMNGATNINFEPNFESETIDFAEFRKRFESLNWCKENSDHPIAFMRAFSDKMNRLRDRLREMKPMARIENGRRTGFIPDDATDEERSEILKMVR